MTFLLEKKISSIIDIKIGVRHEWYIKNPLEENKGRLLSSMKLLPI